MSASYMLLAGQHIEGTGEFDKAGFPIERKHVAGEVFESVHDDYHIRWPEKFQRADQLAPADKTFDAGYQAGLQAALKKIEEDKMKEQMGNIDAVTRAAQTGFNSAFTDGGKPVPKVKRALPNLDQMSVRQLQEFAAAEEIDLGSSKSKEEIVKVIRASN